MKIRRISLRIKGGLKVEKEINDYLGWGFNSHSGRLVLKNGSVKSIDVEIQEFMQKMVDSEIITTGCCAGHIYPEKHPLHDGFKKSIGWVQVDNTQDVKIVLEFIEANSNLTSSCIVLLLNNADGRSNSEFCMGILTKSEVAKVLKQKLSLVVVDELLVRF